MCVKVVEPKVSSLKFYHWRKKMIELLHENVALWNPPEELIMDSTIGGALRAP
jgi:hypothetical protein